jgi:hypothetical protein
MALETGNYINDLDQTYPTGTDTISEGDGHLQLIKKVLKQSFPGVDRVSEYIYVHTSAPTVDVGKGRLWLDTSTTPNLLKIYDGSSFVKLPISATVDYKIMGNDTVGWVMPTADGTANYPLTTTGSNVLAFAQIDTTAIANNAVDGTKIAMGSDAAGDVLYHNGTDYVRLAKPGTPAGEMLTFATSASAPSWTMENVVNVSHGTQALSSTIRQTTYTDTGYTFDYTKVQAATDLYIECHFDVVNWSNFDAENTQTQKVRLIYSTDTVISPTDIQVGYMTDDTQSGTGSVEHGNIASFIWKVSSLAAASYTFKIQCKSLSSADGGFGTGDAAWRVWEITA